MALIANHNINISRSSLWRGPPTLACFIDAPTLDVSTFAEVETLRIPRRNVSIEDPVKRRKAGKVLIEARGKKKHNKLPVY
jgi:hypothetical protein